MRPPESTGSFYERWSDFVQLRDEHRNVFLSGSYVALHGQTVVSSHATEVLIVCQGASRWTGFNAAVRSMFFCRCCRLQRMSRCWRSGRKLGACHGHRRPDIFFSEGPFLPLHLRSSSVRVHFKLPKKKCFERKRKKKKLGTISFYHWLIPSTIGQSHPPWTNLILPLANLIRHWPISSTIDHIGT